jgi:hypothetical protein
MWCLDADGGGDHTRILCILQVYISNVSDVLEVRYECFIQMLQKVDRDVADVAKGRPDAYDGGGRTRIRCMLQVYISNVSAVLGVCCKCFICMLQK